jgi:hypothetical protein
LRAATSVFEAFAPAGKLGGKVHEADVRRCLAANWDVLKEHVKTLSMEGREEEEKWRHEHLLKLFDV